MAEKNFSSPMLLEHRPAPGVVHLCLHRPQVLNALNLSLRRLLAETFSRLDEDDSVRAIVLGGSERAFCAGADLHEYVDAAPLQIVARDMDRLWGAIAQCRKPLIAAVRGYALGGGCELAMHTDLIIAGASARFGQPEVLIGLMPGGGATQRLTRAVGKFRAMHMLLIGEQVDDDAVEPRALALATRIAAMPVTAVRFIKEAVLNSMNSTLDQGLQMERKSFQLLFDSPDKTEGIRARLEKRPPRFEGATE
jgi:enoyl-CoA hydratase